MSGAIVGGAIGGFFSGAATSPRARLKRLALETAGGAVTGSLLGATLQKIRQHSAARQAEMTPEEIAHGASTRGS